MKKTCKNCQFWEKNIFHEPSGYWSIIKKKDNIDFFSCRSSFSCKLFKKKEI